MFVILHFLIDVDTTRPSKTSSFPKGILSILQKCDFHGNQNLNSLAFQVLCAGKYGNPKPETLVISSPDFQENHDFAKYQVFP